VQAPQRVVSALQTGALALQSELRAQGHACSGGGHAWGAPTGVAGHDPA
jgi:hypothetical protein